MRAYLNILIYFFMLLFTNIYDLNTNVNSLCHNFYMMLNKNKHCVYIVFNNNNNYYYYLNSV